MEVVTWVARKRDNVIILFVILEANCTSRVLFMLSGIEAFVHQRFEKFIRLCCLVIRTIDSLYDKRQ